MSRTETATGGRYFCEKDTAALFPPRPRDAHKGVFGYVSLIGGSIRYSGAIRLANLGACAMRSGAGVVRLCAPRSLCGAIVPLILESTLFPLSDREGDFLFLEQEFREAVLGTRAVAFGMGIGHTAETEKAVSYLLKNYEGILILDADGLNALAAIGSGALRKAACRTVLTPHLGEFARLTGKTIPEIRQDPVRLAEAFAAEQKTIVLLKGPVTVVTDGRETLMIDRGCPGMATAGSGDVLSGILSAVCAENPENLLRAVAAGAWLNGRAGEIAQEKNGDVSMIASDTAAAIGQALREIRRVSEQVPVKHGKSAEIEIRAAEPGDLDCLKKLLYQVNQIHADGRPDLFKSGGIKYTDEEILEILRDKHRPLLVAVNREQTVLGYAFCILEETAETTSLRPVRTLYLDDLCVDSEARGCGIGRRLYEAVVSLAKETGADRVTLHAWNFNQEAFGFYEKLGMTPLVTTMEQRLKK